MDVAPSARKTLARLVVALCVATWFVGDVFRGLHLLTTRHVVCVEHGELVHADSAEPRQTGQGDSREVRVSPRGGGVHHHDHCALGVFHPDRSHATVQAASVEPLGARPAALVPLPHAARVARPSVLDYAPKLSPPA